MDQLPLISGNMDRRGFLKTASVASAAVCSNLFTRVNLQTSGQASVGIGTASYTPVGDYPIRPKRGNDVRIKDRSSVPKVRTNAEVTIPIEVQKFEQADRKFGVNVLEAAITSLQTNPDPVIEAQVKRQVRALASQAWRGNSNLEVAAALLSRDRQKGLVGSSNKGRQCGTTTA